MLAYVKYLLAQQAGKGQTSYDEYGWGKTDESKFKLSDTGKPVYYGPAIDPKTGKSTHP